ncbi:MAG: 50S ribosomal protein L24 [Actinobacteria bacterium]|nr:50S ribosomal protein L24 [Actinomycetota bacterium]MCG2807850.1 50S ribosomal protein L24 [Coriobacteriia bacterium]MDO8987058.1 50S ribosomal protein L24 [Coriobacteriia bacterium]MDO9107666.1 50S ribosomal protein L24 [Coriobacteriia bacterium]MDP2232155.1 50S ribosomal protein L24 [Actinomycetota bacterium]
MASSMTIRKGDKVKVITGKDKGKESRVLRVYPEKQRLVVEHVNMIKKAQRPTNKQPQGGILEVEGTIHVSNVMLLCPSCSQPTRVARRRDEGTRVRVCKKCGNDIDK